MSGGWIGVDLDGTLAEYHGWAGLIEIGAPIMPMVERVRHWLALGHEVRIFTARVSDERREAVDAFIVELDVWCMAQFGQTLPVTCVKDMHMIELWDDRAVQVERNVGHPVGHSTRGLP